MCTSAVTLLVSSAGGTRGMEWTQSFSSGQLPCPALPWKLEVGVWFDVCRSQKFLEDFSGKQSGKQGNGEVAAVKYIRMGMSE